MRPKPTKGCRASEEEEEECTMQGGKFLGQLSTYHQL
jgi:hypothetical protein